MTANRESELAELYAFFTEIRSMPQMLQPKNKLQLAKLLVNKRMLSLLKRHTIYERLPSPPAKNAFVLTLLHGAVIDDQGLLIINTKGCADAIAKDPRMRCLKKEYLSPENPNLDGIKIVTPRRVKSGKSKPPFPEVMSPRTERGRTGRWPPRHLRG